MDSCRAVFIWGRLIPLPSTNLSTPSMFLTKVGTTAIYTGGSLIRISWHEHTQSVEPRSPKAVELSCYAICSYRHRCNFWSDTGRVITFTFHPSPSTFTFAFDVHFQVVMQFSCADIVAIFDQTLAEVSLSPSTFTFKLLCNLPAQTSLQYLIRHWQKLSLSLFHL